MAEIKKEIKALTGDEAAAEAMRQINPDVVAVYPITPQTPIAMTFAQFVADGLVDTELVMVESEHSAMSAVVGAAASGARAMTATAANGLALMVEIVYIASSLRLPVVMNVVNRALSAPINIHCDYSYAMLMSQSGWIQIFSETPQEVYDNNLWAVKIAEHPDIFLPVAVNQDGFITSHALERVEVLPDEVVKELVGEPKHPYTLFDFDKPITVGALDLTDSYFEHKRSQADAMFRARGLIEEIGKEVAKYVGRDFTYFEEYKLDDAEVAIVVMGSTAGTVRYVIDELRKEGKKVGLLKVRVFRPFNDDLIREKLSHVKGIAVMDRADNFTTSGGPLFNEVKSAMYEGDARPVISSFVFGLGGREFTPDMARKVVDEAYKDLEAGKRRHKVIYIGVKQGDEEVSYGN